MFLAKLSRSWASDVGTEGGPPGRTRSNSTTRTMKRAFHFRFEFMLSVSFGRAQRFNRGHRRRGEVLPSLVSD